MRLCDRYNVEHRAGRVKMMLGFLFYMFPHVVLLGFRPAGEGGEGEQAGMSLRGSGRGRIAPAWPGVLISDREE